MAEFDVDGMVERFRDRAKAVQERGIPPIEGESRRQFIRQAETDFTDYSLIGTAEWAVEDGKLTLRIPLE